MEECEIRYALFDMDGTLADTMGYWRALTPQALARRGVTLPEEDIDALGTLTFSQGVAYLRERKIPHIEEITREEILTILEGHYRRDARLKAGVRELLDRFRAQGTRMGVATLTPRAQAQVCLQTLGIDGYFEFLFTGEDYPKGKNSPEIFLDAAARFGCDVRRMYLFEDSFYSMKTAHALGIPIVATEDEWQANLREEMLAIATAYFEDGFTRRIK